MTTNLELQPLNPITYIRKIKAEDYDEIKQDSISSQSPKKTEDEYDFFTEVDVKTSHTKLRKNKKGKKKEGQSGIMDIINSELAAAEVAIEKNVVTIVINSMEQHNNYLQLSPKLSQMFQKKYHKFANNGWSSKSIGNLSPIFPRVLGNNLVEPTNIPVEYAEPTKFKNLINNKINNAPAQTKFLDIAIKDFKCINHHQLTLEELLAQKLLSFYNIYQCIKMELESISREITINRETKDNLKQELLKIYNKEEDIIFDASVRKYTGQLIDCKNKYMDTLNQQREVLNTIVSLWSDIEVVREKSKSIKTPYILEVSKRTMVENEFEKEWIKVFDTEFSDLLDKEKYNFVHQYTAYKENKYGKVNNGQKKKLSKPKLNIDIEFLKDTAENVVNNLVIKDKVDITLQTNDTILNDQINDYAAVHTPLFFFKIYVDDIYVCESEHFICDQHFEAAFFESFSVQLLPENRTISIILFENGEEVSNYKLYISELNQNGVTEDFNKQEFVYKNIIECGIKVGCGHSIKEITAANKVRLKSSNVFKENVYTVCETYVQFRWSDHINQNNENDLKTYVKISTEIKGLLNRVSKPTLVGLKEIIEKIYDQDIGDNEEIINTLTDMCRGNTENNNENPMDINSEVFLRIKLIHLRNKGEFSNVENKMIPLYASQISTEQLNCLQKDQDNDFDVQYFSSDKYADIDPIEIQRFIGTKYIENLNKNLLKNLNDNLLRKTYKDVVCDFRNLNIRTLFSNQKNLTNISNRNKGESLEDIMAKEQDIFITIQRAFNLPERTASILNEGDEDDHGDNIAGYRVRSLRPFVRVTYQGFSEQTATAIGCHPTWNQTLKIPTKPGKPSCIHIDIYDEQKINITDNNYTEDDSFQNRTMHFRCHNKWLGTLEVPLYGVLDLGKIQGTFKINMPPMLLGYESNKIERDTSRSLIPEVTKLLKKENPFITLKISTKSQLGCIHRYDLATPNNAEDDYIIKHLNSFIREYQLDYPTKNLTLSFIDSAGKNKCVTQYLQPIPVPDYELFPKNPKRSESAVSKSSNLSKSSSSKRSSDIEKGVDIEKESLNSSYDGRKWKKNDNPVQSMINALLRYVSLIPCYEVTENHVVTLMGVELLRILHGSALDHTILLASYFLYLGLKTFVAIGLGLPRGRSSYVLTKYDLRTQRMELQGDQLYGRTSFSLFSRNVGSVWYVYDATTGERFELRDVSCPLKMVYFVFDNDNIWVNMQSPQDCESVSFDFTNSSDWKPVFDKHIFIMKHPVLADTNLYSNTTKIEQLRNMLENKIKVKIQKWRSHLKTIWNRYCSSLLKETLPQWEYWALNPSDPRPVLGQRMRQLMVTYNVYGFPINLPYTSTKAVVTTVKSTSVHLNDDPNAEFALGVDVYAYPNNVVSVWVFLASVSKI